MASAEWQLVEGDCDGGDGDRPFSLFYSDVCGYVYDDALYSRPSTCDVVLPDAVRRTAGIPTVLHPHRGGNPAYS